MDIVTVCTVCRNHQLDKDVSVLGTSRSARSEPLREDRFLLNKVPLFAKLWLDTGFNVSLVHAFVCRHLFAKSRIKLIIVVVVVVVVVTAVVIVSIFKH